MSKNMLYILFLTLLFISQYEGHLAMSVIITADNDWALSMCQVNSANISCFTLFKTHRNPYEMGPLSAFYR